MDNSITFRHPQKRMIRWDCHVDGQPEGFGIVGLHRKWKVRPVVKRNRGLPGFSVNLPLLFVHVFFGRKPY